MNDTLIGRKVKGFYFDNVTDTMFVSMMRIHIGEVGIIIKIRNNNALVKFKTMSWWYPLSMIEEHLLPEDSTPVHPEKWMIKVTDENREELKKWVESRPNVYRGINGNMPIQFWVLSYPNYDNSYLGYNSSGRPYKKEGAVEIDIETFRLITNSQELLPLEQKIEIVQSLKSKPMKIFKTKTIKVNGKDRQVTVAVTINAANLVVAGYSVKSPEDKDNKELAETIALGRALKDRTNINEKMYIHETMKKKFILYAVADNIFNRIEKGSIEIKGVK